MHSTQFELDTRSANERMQRQFRDASLDALATQLSRGHMPNYPTKRERLVMEQEPYSAHGTVTLPNEGPWCTGQVLPTQIQKHTEILAMVGRPKHCTLDANWRPLHPWWRQMITRPDIGAAIGRGSYYHWGANYTADAAVIAQLPNKEDHILLIRRGDTGDWALPGGFVDGSENGKAAALRELQEESGLTLTANTPARQLYTGPVVDIRTTLHAWAETSLWCFDLKAEQLPNVVGMDDAAEARWFSCTDLPANIYGSHGALIARVLQG
jgi:ADP-ribose pyrophosphatase YjhB (NUDIX family)